MSKKQSGCPRKILCSCDAHMSDKFDEMNDNQKWFGWSGRSGMQRSNNYWSFKHWWNISKKEYRILKSLGTNQDYTRSSFEFQEKSKKWQRLEGRVPYSKMNLVIDVITEQSSSVTLKKLRLFDSFIENRKFHPLLLSQELETWSISYSFKILRNSRLLHALSMRSIMITFI